MQERLKGRQDFDWKAETVGLCLWLYGGRGGVPRERLGIIRQGVASPANIKGLRLAH